MWGALKFWQPCAREVRVWDLGWPRCFMLSWGLPRREGVALLGVPGVPLSKTEGREHSGLPVNVVFSTPELCLREGGEKELVGKEKPYWSCWQK